MEIGAVQSGATGALESAGGPLGKDEFLKLLITQLRHQDPLSPMENEAFLAQLAQFSTLEQMQSLNTTLEASMFLTQSLNNSAAASLIGKHVRASGDQVSLPESGPVELGYFLSSEADSISVSVFDENHRLVRTLSPTEGASGPHRLSWDGRDAQGARLPAGNYTFEVQAFDADGRAVPASTLISGLVDGVTFRNGSAYLMVDGRELPLAAILEVFIPNSEGGDSR